MKLSKWLVLSFIVGSFNIAALIFFGMIHVELWDYSMNNILISREEFAMMNRRGLVLFLLSISSSALFVKTWTVYNTKNI